jgi:hypothetical protein
MNQTAHDLAVKYCSALSDETATKAIGDAFVSGFEAGQPNWILVTERLPVDKDEMYLCVTVDGSWIIGEYENAYTFRDASGTSWRCNFWCPIADSLLNFKP